MKKFLLALALQTMSATLLNAQAIKGSVKDEKGKFVNAATVSLLNSKDSSELLFSKYIFGLYYFISKQLHGNTRNAIKCARLKYNLNGKKIFWNEPALYDRMLSRYAGFISGSGFILILVLDSFPVLRIELQTYLRSWGIEFRENRLLIRKVKVDYPIHPDKIGQGWRW